MAYEPLEYLLPRAGGSIYKLVRLASKRASELANNQPPLIENTASHKLTTVALKEILAGKVTLKNSSSKSSKSKKDNTSTNSN